MKKTTTETYTLTPDDVKRMIAEHMKRHVVDAAVDVKPEQVEFNIKDAVDGDYHSHEPYKPAALTSVSVTIKTEG